MHMFKMNTYTHIHICLYNMLNQYKDSLSTLPSRAMCLDRGGVALGSKRRNLGLAFRVWGSRSVEA